MTYQIRKMSEKDWSEVSQIYQQGIDTGLATLQPDCPSFADWDQAHLKACRLVIVDEVKVIGWAALTPVSGRCVYSGVVEVSVYIDPSYWGRGVGKALLTELVSHSEDEGFWTLQSSILRENTASIRLHERSGFRMVGYRERIGRDRNGKWRDTALMEKRSNKDMAEVYSPNTTTLRESKDIMKMNKPKVAFICVHNSCRSQIAEALGKHLAAEAFESYSAGTETKPKINQDAVRLMKELYGIDMEQTQRSKLLDELPKVDVVTTMGCDVGCPFLPGQHVEDWGLDDPTGKGDEVFRQTIQAIHNKVLALKEAVEKGNIKYR